MEEKILEEIQKEEIGNKNRNLILGIAFDAIGMLSFSIPLVGEFSDVIWAPMAGFLMTWMYKGTVGKVGGIFTFLEDILAYLNVAFASIIAVSSTTIPSLNYSFLFLCSFFSCMTFECSCRSKFT